MRRTKDDAEQTRENILNAATSVFGEKGFDKSTLDEIAKKASVTRGAIYWHFKNKGEIFDAIHYRLHQEFMETLEHELFCAEENALQNLKLLCIKLMQDLDQDELKKQAVILFLTKTDYSGELAIYKEQHGIARDKGTLVFQHFFEKSIAQNALSSDYDPELLAQTITCLLRGMVLEYLLQTDNFDVRVKSEQMFNLFFDAL